MYAICRDMPGVSASEAAAVGLRCQQAGPPAGAVATVGGPTSEGWRIITVWQDQQSWTRFRDAVLRPAELAAAEAGEIDPSAAAGIRELAVNGDPVAALG